jgi:hypothetical protein
MSSQSLLSSRAMLVSLHMTSWQASKFDARISEEVAEAHHADRDAGRYNKALVPKACLPWKNLKAAHGAARATHREMTLPWAQDGSRVLPVANYEAYVDAMGRHQTAIEEAVALFLAAYPEIRQEAPDRLGSMFSERDWPDAFDLRAKFSFGWDIMPLPDAGDFRVRLADEDSIRDSIRSTVEATTAQAMADVWRRLYDATAHMTARLRGTGNCDCSACGGAPVGSDRLNESAVENLRSLTTLLPRLNLTGDERLTAATTRLQEMLADVNVEDLRASRELRDRVAEQAAAEVVAVADVAPEAALPTGRRRVRTVAQMEVTNSTGVFAGISAPSPMFAQGGSVDIVYHGAAVAPVEEGAPF